jgi:hypothetical protein
MAPSLSMPAAATAPLRLARALSVVAAAFGLGRCGLAAADCRSNLSLWWTASLNALPLAGPVHQSLNHTPPPCHPPHTHLSRSYDWTLSCPESAPQIFNDDISLPISAGTSDTATVTTIGAEAPFNCSLTLVVTDGDNVKDTKATTITVMCVCLVICLTANKQNKPRALKHESFCPCRWLRTTLSLMPITNPPPCSLKRPAARLP